MQTRSSAHLNLNFFFLSTERWFRLPLWAVRKRRRHACWLHVFGGFFDFVAVDDGWVLEWWWWTHNGKLLFDLVHINLSSIMWIRAGGVWRRWKWVLRQTPTGFHESERRAKSDIIISDGKIVRISHFWDFQGKGFFFQTKPIIITWKAIFLEKTRGKVKQWAPFDVKIRLNVAVFARKSTKLAVNNKTSTITFSAWYLSVADEDKQTITSEQQCSTEQRLTELASYRHSIET